VQARSRAGRRNMIGLSRRGARPEAQAGIHAPGYRSSLIRCRQSLSS
jgi:hypothetical protein